MNLVLIGNIISFIGCGLMVFVGLIREKRRILYVQCIQFTLQGTANFLLGGISGVIANIVSILRNITFARFKNSLGLKLFFIGLQFVLSLPSLGSFINWLPFLAAVLFTWFIDVKSEVRLKIVIIITQILWIIYDFVHLNYVAVAFDSFTMISNAVGIYTILRGANKQK